MRGDVLNASVIGSVDLDTTTETEELGSDVSSPLNPAGWNVKDFEQRQIQGLVRRVFFSSPERPVRQVVFSAVEPETDIREICRWVGEALALETSGSVAIAGNLPEVLRDRDLQRDSSAGKESRDGINRLRQAGRKARANLWLIPGPGRVEQSFTAASLNQYLSGMRREFDYSIVGARAAGESNEAMAMAQFADGIILVLSARRTRRAAAKQLKEALEGTRARMIGTVLSDRAFPLPDSIYRRL